MGKKMYNVLYVLSDAPHAHTSYSPEIMGIFGKESKMTRKIFAPHLGIGTLHSSEKPKSKQEPVHRARAVSVAPPPARKPEKQRIAKPGVVELVERGWPYRVASQTSTHAVVEFTSPDGTERETRTVLSGMLPDMGRFGRPILHLKKSPRNHEVVREQAAEQGRVIEERGYGFAVNDMA